MIFFRAKGQSKDLKKIRRYKLNSDDEVMEKKEEIMDICNSFNSNSSETYFFVSNISDGKIDLGIISNCVDNVKKNIGEIFKKIGVKEGDYTLEEITFNTFRDHLCAADRTGFIEDDGEVLERFNLGFLNRFGSVEHGENLIENTDYEKIIDIASSYLCKESFIPEIDRIYAGKNNSKAKGLPVHYMVETDDRETRKILYKALIQSLYLNNRIECKRYSFMDYDCNSRMDSYYLDSLYKMSEGGTVVIRFNSEGDIENTGYASSALRIITEICDIVKKHSNKVQTIICLPRACDKLKMLFFDNLVTITVVEIKEEFASGDKAKDFLKLLAKKNNIRTDKSLFNKVKDGETYLTSDLNEIFSEWYNVKLKTTIYPQYKDFASVSKEVIKAKPKGSAYDELMEMIGLDEAKAVIIKALNYFKIQKLCKEKGMEENHPAMHMVFTGNPGTAKTTVARLFTQIMKDNNLLSKGQLIEVGRSDLVGKYVGWTANIVKEKFNMARGGVLFIDEAYSLTDDRDGSYGDEAINTIVQEMENLRDEVVVIFAGYPDKMEKFLNKNPGLRSRIAFTIPFKDYNRDELCSIANLIGNNQGIRFTSEAMEKLGDLFEKANSSTDFGNGRYVRNVLEQARMNQASRLLKLEFGDITKDLISTIEAEDINELNIGFKPKEVRKIGFI